MILNLIHNHEYHRFAPYTSQPTDSKINILHSCEDVLYARHLWIDKSVVKVLNVVSLAQVCLGWSVNSGYYNTKYMFVVKSVKEETERNNSKSIGKKKEGKKGTLKRKKYRTWLGSGGIPKPLKYCPHLDRQSVLSTTGCAW